MATATVSRLPFDFVSAISQVRKTVAAKEEHSGNRNLMLYECWKNYHGHIPMAAGAEPVARGGL